MRSYRVAWVLAVLLAGCGEPSDAERGESAARTACAIAYGEYHEGDAGNVADLAALYDDRWVPLSAAVASGDPDRVAEACEPVR